MNRVIRASAGTGKTWRLSVEYLALLLHMGRETGYTRPEVFSSILVITFTRKATAEIRERILHFLAALTDPDSCAGHRTAALLRERLELSDEAGIGFLRDVLAAMRSRPDKLHIRTIDGFVNSVFRGMVAPMIQVGRYEIDPASDPAVVLETLSRLLSDEEEFRRLEELFLRYAEQVRDLSRYERLVLGLASLRPVIGQMRPRWPETPSMEWFLRFRNEAVALLLEFMNRAGDGWSKELYSEFVRELNHYGVNAGNAATTLPRVLHDGFLRRYADQLGAESVFKKRSAFLKANPDLPERYAALVPLLERGVAADAREQSFLLRLIADRVYETWDRVRLDLRRFNYDDILAQTVRLLSDMNDESSEVAAGLVYEALSSRIRYLLVDEFQDTSVAQWRLLLPLLRESSSGSGIHPDGGFVTVGDEKQAIYGWRGGERGLLAAVGKALPGAHTTGERLDTSRRSLPAVNDFVNRVFQRVASLHPEWIYEPVKTARDDQPGYVETVFDRYSPNGDRKRAEVLRDFLDKFFLPRYRMLGEDADTAILTRTNPDLAFIAGHLNRLGIPFRLDTARPLVEHPAVRPLLSLLRWRAWGRFIDLLAFLRSDYAGLSDADFKTTLLRFRESRAEEFAPDFAGRMLEGIGDGSLPARVLPLIGAADPATLVRTAMDRFGAVSRFTTDSDFRNLDRFLNILETFVDSAPFHGLLRHLEHSASNTPQVGSELGGGVRLLTIHKAKGLEFDNLFVALDFNLRRGGERNLLSPEIWTAFDATYENLDDALLLTRGTRGSLGLLTIDSPFPEVAAIARLRERHTAEALTGEIDNLYVALTRARDRLFVYASAEGSEATLADLDPANGLKGLYAVLRECAVESVPLAVKPGQIPDTPSIAISPLASGWIPRPVARSLPAALTDTERTAAFERHRSNAALMGSLVHDYLSRIRVSGPEEFERAACEVMTRYGTLLPPDRLRIACELIRQWVETRPDLFGNRGATILTEYQVYDGDQEFRIDRLVVDRERRRVLILDYKTGMVDGEWQSETYPRLIRNLPGIDDAGWTVEFAYVPLDELGTRLRSLFKQG